MKVLIFLLLIVQLLSFGDSQKSEERRVGGVTFEQRKGEVKHKIETTTASLSSSIASTSSATTAQTTTTVPTTTSKVTTSTISTTTTPLTTSITTTTTTMTAATTLKTTQPTTSTSTTTTLPSTPSTTTPPTTSTTTTSTTPVTTKASTTTAPSTTTQPTTTKTTTSTTEKPTTVPATATSTAMPASSTLRDTASTLKGSTGKTCVCVPANTCSTAGGNSSGADETDYGDGKMDVRIINTNRNPPRNSGTNQSIVGPASTGVPLISVNVNDCRKVNPNLEACCPAKSYQCGMSFPPMNGSKSLQGRAMFGEYPWQAILFTKATFYIGSAVLIDQRHLLTVAHLVYNKNQTYKVRLGEWDTTSRAEPLDYMEFDVIKIMIHPKFNSKNLQNNIAILRVDPAVPLGAYPTIATACLPDKPINQTLTCYVSGWGRNDFDYGTNQAIQRKVDVPIVDNPTCEATLRMTRLGKYFKLDPGFMCAGGEAGKDACTGDGGAPLVCKVVNQWYAVGLVAWGISCGAGVPSVYTNIAYYLPWIQNTTTTPN